MMTKAIIILLAVSASSFVAGVMAGIILERWHRKKRKQAGLDISGLD